MLKLTYFLTIVLLGKQIGFLSQPQPPNGVEAPVLNTDFDSFNLSRSLLLYCSQDFSPRKLSYQKPAFSLLGGSTE